MKTDSEFVQSLSQSETSVMRVAKWLKSLGFRIRVDPTTVRPEFIRRADFADGGDIELTQRVEVKHRRELHFTCAEDYPYDDVIIDEKYKVERIPIADLRAYIILNAGGTHACIADGRTRKHWSLIRKFDRKDGQEREFYVCQKNLCCFEMLP